MKYAETKNLMPMLYKTLFELGKVRHKRDFSRFYFGREVGYLTMISTGKNRHASIGAIHYLVKRLKHDILCESDANTKRRLTDCLNLADLELAIRLMKGCLIRFYGSLRSI